MKYTLLTFLILVIGCVNTQAQPAFDYRPNGSAVIVQNIDKSVQWYQSVFGFTVKTKMNEPNVYKVVILESPTFMLELIELTGSLTRTEVLKEKPEGTQIQGHSKIGFLVNDIDKCLRHLKAIGVNVPRVWTDQGTKKRNFLITDPDGNYIQFFD